MNMASIRIKSCERCRLLKTRCDREKQHPHACTRCRIRGIPCFLGASAASTAPVPDSTSSTPPLHQTVAQVPSNGGIGDDAPNGMALNGELLTVEESRQAFAYFFAEFHCHFPFLQRLDAYDCLVESPLLFWTIITITFKVTHRPRFERLQPHLRILAAGVLSTGHQGIPECQALCLLCLWPLDAVEGRGGDNIHLYARVAYAIAVDRGLHRPGFAHEYRQVTDSRPNHQYPATVRDATWCAVYFVDHQVSSRGGVASTVREDHALSQMLKTAAAPVAEQCRLVAIRNRFLDAIGFHGASLSGMASPSERIILLKMFSAEVADYLDQLPDTSAISRILGNFTAVSIGGFCLADDMSSSRDVDLLPLVRAGRDAAMAIPDLVGPLMWETLPMHIVRCLVYACIFIVKLQNSRFKLDDHPSNAFVDRTLSILLPLSFGNDYATRSRTVLKPHLSRGDAHGSGSVVCKSRMGANLYWDMLRGEQGLHGWTVDKHQIWAEIVNNMPS